MGFLDRLFGRREQRQPQQRYGGEQWQDGRRQLQPVQSSEDERAIARYQYLLRTAPPERIEQVHTEAFAKLTPEQREQVMRRLSRDLPPGEAPATDSPQDMARAATRAEMSQPGYLQRSFAGPGMGGMFAGSMLGSIAGVVVGSAIASSLLGGFEQSPEAQAVGEGDPGGGEGDLGGDNTGGGNTEGDYGAGEAGTGDFGGGDFGAGDFGGGDFGGFGDF